MRRVFHSQLVLLAGMFCLALTARPNVLLAQSEGQADLDAATSLKLNASSMADFERVIELCESAIEKGLDEETKKLATPLITATLFQHGSRFAQALFDPRERTSRPAMLKQFALRDFYKILEHDDSLPQVHMMIARLEAVNVGRVPADAFNKGKASADRAIELLADDKPMLSKAYVLRAGYAGNNGAERLEYLNRAIESDPQNTDALRLRGKSRLVDGELLAAAGQLEQAKIVREKAIADFSKLLETNPDDPDALQAVAELLGRLGDYDEALSIANKAIDQNPRASSLYILRGRLYQKQKEYDKAIKDLNRALDLQPDSFIALLDRAEVHWDRDDKKAAAKDYGLAREARRLQDQDVAETVLKRITVRSEGNTDKAFDQIRHFMELDELNAETDERRPDPDYRYQIGRRHLRSGKPNECVETLTILLENIDEKSRDKKSLSARFLSLRDRADAYLSLGKHNEAVADYEQAMQIQPNDNGVLNNLAWVLATSTYDEVRSSDRALKFAKKACEVTDYKAAHILSTLAAAYAEAGDFEQAIEWSTKAVGADQVDENSTPGTREQLRNELESYKQKKPWRELQDVTTAKSDAADAEEKADTEEAEEEAEVDGANEEEAVEDLKSKEEEEVEIEEGEPVGANEE